MNGNRITGLFGIQYPVIQGGMIWVSGYKLAAAVSEAGGLGLIGGGSMRPDVFRQHVQKCKAATGKPFGVNIPLLYPYAEEQIGIAVEEGVKIVFTSAGSPKKYTSFLKEKGIRVAHVVANLKFALKSQEAGVDAVVAEGFEAGGHNGPEELTTMTLIPEIAPRLDIPLIAAGGIGTGRGMLAAFALGAEGVQIGSRFVATVESSAHDAFKRRIVEAKAGETRLLLKKHIPVRLLDNPFADRIKAMEAEGASREELAEALGKGRAMKGMFEGDTEEGELEIGQISALINEIKPAGEVVREIINEFRAAKNMLKDIDF
jgi:enoyl-[acyl-carrier protein] reductase II